MGIRGPKLTQQTLEILRLCREGQTYRSIAELYGLSQQRVCEIALKNGLRRQHQIRDGGTAKERAGVPSHNYQRKGSATRLNEGHLYSLPSNLSHKHNIPNGDQTPSTKRTNSTGDDSSSSGNDSAGESNVE